MAVCWRSAHPTRSGTAATRRLRRSCRRPCDGTRRNLRPPPRPFKTKQQHIFQTHSHMRNTLETRLGLFAALTVIAAMLVLETIGTLERFQRGARLYALFNDIQDLKEGDRVKMAGVDVGRVDKIDFADQENKVRVA